jgi:transcription termination factor Rho
LLGFIHCETLVQNGLVIFEEFKGTGNGVRLDRKLLAKRIFPVDLTSSSTRRDDLLWIRRHCREYVVMKILQ